MSRQRSKEQWAIAYLKYAVERLKPDPNLVMDWSIKTLESAIEKLEPKEIPMIEQTSGNDLVVIASDPAEMAQSQTATIARVEEKIIEAKAELTEAEDIKRAADMAKIDDTAAVRLIKKATHRIQYLEKTLEALKAGYVLVPNFPGDVISIRVNRKSPSQRNVFGAKHHVHAEREKPDTLPIGEGQYVDSIPASRISENTDATGQVVVSHSMVVGDFISELALPVEFMRPTIINRISEAMNLKLFDEIALVTGETEVKRSWHEKRVKGDPLVIGRIVNHAGGKQP